MSISPKTRRLLLAKSGSVCANPNCHFDLFLLFESGSITNIEELAHIIGESKSGPRGNEDLTERDEYANLVVLCPNCHTIIDKNPEIYTVETIQSWKKQHEEKLNSLFSIPKFSNRKDLRSKIEKLLLENFSIYNIYGPNSEEANGKPLSDYAEIWEQKTIQTIIPNNRMIKLLVEANYELLNLEEKKIFERYKRHCEDFEYNKLSGDKISNPQMFPQEFEKILKNG